MEQKSGFLGGLAKTLNVGGSAIVTLYDAGAIIVGGAAKYVKETAPELPAKTKNIVSSGIATVFPGEKGKLESKIRDYEKKIKKLYYEIGEKSSKHTGEGSALEAEAIKALIDKVREHESEIDKMKLRLLEIEEEKKALKMKATLVKKDLKISDEQPLSSLRSAIEKAAQEGEFNSESESEIFKKVANDLLDADMEVKILAAVELGKMKNQAALPILLEALKFDNPSLTSEIINALRNIDANSAIPLLKEVMDMETMKPESVTEDASLEETVVEETEETEGAEFGKRGAKQTIYASEELSNLLKEDLLKICKKKKIECEKRLTKVEIIKLILEKQAML